MRRLISFECEGHALGASLDAGDGAAGLVMVTGGTQTRIGSHRMYERLAAALAERGISCLRFDRRGVGDSGGEDPGFRGSGPDIAAAAAALRRECPTLRRLHGAPHSRPVELFVVTDGDSVESAWHGERVSGSLARWAWRQTSPHEAFYDEARWGAEPGAVVRVRRKAQLLWSRPENS